MHIRCHDHFACELKILQDKLDELPTFKHLKNDKIQNVEAIKEQRKLNEADKRPFNVVCKWVYL